MSDQTNATITVYTNAIPDYDYSTVLASEPTGMRFTVGMDRAKPFRKLTLENRENGYYAEYQCNRYRSGGYLVLNQTQWDRELRDGYIMPMAEEQADATGS